jgi:SAM-dependent methyltransferase
MPSLEWNRKWGPMLTEFERDPGDEPYWGHRWGDPETFAPLVEVRRRLLEPCLHPGQVVVEIGGGGGRWTKYLLRSARRLIVVELNPEAFEHLRRRFPADRDRMEFHCTSGYEMPAVGEGEVDLVFTFDVFVHIEPDGIARYLAEIERVLRPGGRAIVHYADKRKSIAAENRGFSDMDRERMEALLARTRLRVLEHDDEVMFHSNVVVLER